MTPLDRRDIADIRVIDSPDAASTETIGAEVAAAMRPGQVVGLVGELGAGKTVFVRGAVRGAGGNPDDVRSPTFTLLNVYGCDPTTVHHFDLYRLQQGSDLEGIGFQDFSRQDGITFVEWADRFPESAAEVDIWVTLEFVEGQDGRKITVRSDTWDS